MTHNSWLYLRAIMNLINAWCLIYCAFIVLVRVCPGICPPFLHKVAEFYWLPKWRLPDLPVSGRAIGGLWLLFLGLTKIERGLFLFPPIRWFPGDPFVSSIAFASLLLGLWSVRRLLRPEGLNDTPWDKTTERRNGKDRREGWGKLETQEIAER